MQKFRKPEIISANGNEKGERDARDGGMCDSKCAERSANRK